MKKGIRVFLNIIYTIFAAPFGVAAAVCLLPFIAIGLIISLPVSIVADIWTPGFLKKYNE